MKCSIIEYYIVKYLDVFKTVISDKLLTFCLASNVSVWFLFGQRFDYGRKIDF
jgi:hypothetical protein